MKYVEQFCRPDIDKVVEYYREQFTQHGIKDYEPEREAQRFFDACTKQGWIDASGQSVKFWPMYADKDIQHVAQRAKLGNTVPKRTLAVVDCCWRLQNECACRQLVPAPKVELADFSATFAAQIAAADAETRNSKLETGADGSAQGSSFKDQVSVSDAELVMQHLRLARRHSFPIADYAEAGFIKSATHDIARNIFNPGRDADNPGWSARSDEYFTRMGKWLTFLFLTQEQGSNDLVDEAYMAYSRWLQVKGLPDHAAALAPDAQPIAVLRSATAAAKSDGSAINDER